MSTQDVRAVVREKYGQIAQAAGCCGGGSCCGGATDVDEAARQIGYCAEDLAGIPSAANLGLGCGNPLEYAKPQPGEAVLDLGSGAGLDCFLAARAVGAGGHVIGVDMTAAMIEKARANAAAGGYVNVEFRLGEIEHLPLPDDSVDLVISNCVINLSPDKPQVFRDALRVLKPGGRMLISDLVLLRPISPALRNSVAAYVGCVAGALQKSDYLAAIRDAGFAAVDIVAEHRYDVGLDALGGELQREAYEAVSSIKVRATKPN